MKRRQDQRLMRILNLFDCMWTAGHEKGCSKTVGIEIGDHLTPNNWDQQFKNTFMIWSHDFKTAWNVILCQGQHYFGPFLATLVLLIETEALLPVNIVVLLVGCSSNNCNCDFCFQPHCCYRLVSPHRQSTYCFRYGELIEGKQSPFFPGL